MHPIFITDEVLKLLKSNDFKDLQLANNPPKSRTFSVENLLKSIDNSLWHSLKISNILVKESVL
jgi:hypothetical protein